MESNTKKFGIIITRTNTFANGMNQNAIYLYLLIKQLGYDCDLLSYDETHTQIVYNALPVKLITSDLSKFNPKQYTALIIITISLDKEIYDICNEMDVKVIGYVCGNSLCMTIEDTATAHTRSVVFGHNDSPIHKAWILESFPFMKAYTEILRGVKAQLVPHVWNSGIVEYYCKYIQNKDPALLLYAPNHHTQKKLTLVIPESNINFVKTCVVQLMAAEKLHSINPDLIDEIFIFCYPMESKSLNTLVSTLNVGKKVRKFARLSVCEIFLHFKS